MAHWVRATRCESLRREHRQLTVVEGRRLALFHLEGCDYAIENRCPHRQGPVGAGTLAGTRLTCPWHDRTFDLRDGSCLDSGLPGLCRYRVRREGDWLLVDLESGSADSPASRQVFRYLVRYGVPGHVAHVGSPGRVEVRRGDLVLVHTDRGQEVARVLVAEPESASPSRTLAGELLRPLEAAEVVRYARPIAPEPAMLEACRERLRQHGVSVSLLDGEVLFDGQTVVLYHLGEPVAALGRVATELSRQWPKWRVQFEQLEPLALSDADHEPSGAAGATGETGERERLPAGAAAAGSDEPAAVRLTVWEKLKAGSDFLRGRIRDELAEAGDRLSLETSRLLQFHGVYRQRRREPSSNSQGENRKLPATFMVRVRVPGGRLTATQFQELLALADQHGDGTLRITSRQGLQFHGIARGRLHDTVRGLEARLLSTFGACGDTCRNIMSCPAPLPDPVRRQLQRLAGQLSAHFAPRSGAWFEVWVDDPQEESAGGRSPDGNCEEPVYGRQYLPRKFKLALAPPGDNCVEVHTQDLGLVAVPDTSHPERIAGFELLVGGGMGVTPDNVETFPRLAEPLGFCRYGDALPVAAAVVELFRDHGGRTNRRRARFKYLVQEWGIARLRDELRPYLRDVPLLPPGKIVAGSCEDHLGWHRQADGRWFLGLLVDNGRIQDADSRQLKTALRQCLRQFQPAIRLTPQQNLLLCDLAEAHRQGVERLLAEHGVDLGPQVVGPRRLAMACPALPTCGLAVTEAERRMPDLLRELECLLRELGLGQEAFTFRLAGCPNGCSRPYVSEIGLVGRAADRYDIWVGGSRHGDRLARLLAGSVPAGQCIATLRPLLERFRERRQPGELLGDFCHRTHAADSLG